MKVTLKAPQLKVFRNPRRFRVLAAGRRFGKTYLALTELCRAAWGPNRLAWYVAPTYRQAKRIAWKPLKQMTQEYWASIPNETDLSIELISGGTIALRGADNYDSLRGDGLDFVVLDEYASMAQEAWSEVLRPALSDRLGRGLFIGTPKGLNHFHDLYQNAQEQAQWEAFHYTTEEGGNVAAEEIESASSELDERTYRQEFQASFENLSHGVVYYAFSRGDNLREVRGRSDERIYWSLDFNVDPMTSVVCQIEDHSSPEDRRYGRSQKMVQVLEEIVLPNSNTAEMCEAFVSRVRSWGRGVQPHAVRIYGDAAGAARSTAGRSDYEIIRQFFRTQSDFQVSYHVPRSNPAVRDRVNAVNGMLCNQQGQRRLLVNPGCKQLIQDLERVSWKADSHDNLMPQLDKTNPRLTHVSDALGYLIEAEFGLHQVGGPR
jgi:Terminase large subunit, T4likevirus-type, N-terminal/Terminase RNaseH-like domain